MLEEYHEMMRVDMKRVCFFDEEEDDIVNVVFFFFFFFFFLGEIEIR